MLLKIIFIVVGACIVYDCWRMFDYKRCKESRWDSNCRNILCLKYEICGMDKYNEEQAVLEGLIQDDTEENKE